MAGIDLERVLVPLDGSDYAEAVLPAARYFAEHANSEITLLHIVEKNPPQAVHGQHHLTTKVEAENYLAALLGSGWPSSGRITSRITNANSSKVAGEIARQQKETATGLTVLCTHGRNGLNHLLNGSIAQQTCSLSRKPILLIHPDHSQFNPTRLLVPVDGTSEHEHAIDTALDLAQVFGIPLELLLVIPTPNTVPSRLSMTQRMLPFLTRQMLDMEEEEAQAYLESKKQQICAHLESRVKGGCMDCDFTIRRGDVAQIIMESVRKTPDCLLILGTHGRTGFQGFWEGSVANKVGTSLRQPMLLVPVD